MDHRFALLAMLLPAALGAQQDAGVVQSASLVEAACIVERVVDGDTFRCADGERVRLLLIDAPESQQEDYGLRAKLALEELVAVGDTVRLEPDVEPRDRYGRLLAYVWADTLLVNEELLRRGYAVVAVYPPNVRRVERFRAAAAEARQRERGLWATPAFDCLPADFRRRVCR
ncbi:MAG: thermonuclease family protein [Longimicrobiales bacterium]